MIESLITPSQLITFNPTVSSFQALIEKFPGGEEEQTLQSVFYAELVSRAVQAVSELKQGKPNEH